MSYIDQLNCKAESLQQLDAKIQLIFEEPGDIERDTYKSIEIQDVLIEKLTRLKRYLDKNNATVSPATVPDSVSRDSVVPSAPASRLPKLDLPKFSGNPFGWQTFWDSFQAGVHSNPKLTGVEKLNYLRSLLDGEASRTVSGFTLTNANYEQSISAGS